MCLPCCHYSGNLSEVIIMFQEKYYRSILGASACVKLKRYEEATSWCDKGLAVSFETWC